MGGKLLESCVYLSRPSQGFAQTGLESFAGKFGLMQVFRRKL